MQGNILSPGQIYDEVIKIGVKKAKNPRMQSTLLSGVLAGAFIGLGGFAAMLASHSISNYGIAKLVSGGIFPVGLILILICGAELFTGNSLLVIAYMEKKIDGLDLVKNLSIVYIGNFIGASFVAIFLFLAGSFTANGGELGAYALKVASNKESLGFTVALFSGILCNFLVAIAVWGSYGARDVVGKIFMAFFPIMAFIVAGFQHSIANMYYFTSAILIKLNPEMVKMSGLSSTEIANINFTNAINALIPVTIGNLISGMVFVGVSYWFIYGKKPNAVVSEISEGELAEGYSEDSNENESNLKPKHVYN